jgi:hypothetical protein
MANKGEAKKEPSGKSGGFTSRYTQYARLTGATSPETALARDIERWPGGKMCGFILFINERWAAYRKARGLKTYDILTDADHAAFDAALAAEVSR